MAYNRYTNLAFVCVCVCVCVCVRAGGHWKPFDCDSNRFFFFFSAKLYTAGCYIMEPTSTASKGASSRLKEALLQSVVQKLDREVGLRVAARRLPKSLSRESRLSMDASRREVILF